MRAPCAAAATRPCAYLVAAICRKNPNQFEFVRQITATKFCPRDNDFHISHEAICCRNLSQRRVAAICRIVYLGLKRSRSQSFYISVKCCSCFTCERLWLVTRVREAMVRPVTSPDPAWRSSGSLESAGPVWKKKETQNIQGPVNSEAVHTVPVISKVRPTVHTNLPRKWSTLFKPEGFENAGFSFQNGGKNFLKWSFLKRWPYDNNTISLHLMCFQSEIGSVLKFHRRSMEWTSHHPMTPVWIYKVSRVDARTKCQRILKKLILFFHVCLP